MKYPFFFDYIYYRIARAFIKEGGKHGAVLCVILIQLIFISDILMLVASYLIRNSFVALDQLRTYHVIEIIGLIALLPIIRYNIKRFDHLQYPIYKKHWSYESRQQFIFKGFAVLLVSVSPVLILIFGAVLLKTLFS